MKKPYNTDDRTKRLREKIIGLGEHSLQKSYYPQLQKHIQQLEEQTHQLSQALQEVERSRKYAEEHQKRYKMVLELMSDYIFKLTVEPDGTLSMDSVTENFSTITGHALAKANTFEQWINIFHPEDVDTLLKSFSDLIAQKQSIALECRTIMQHQQLQWVQMVAQSVLDTEQQHVVGIVGAVKDITKRKLAEEKTRELNRELERRVTQRTAELEYVNDELRHFAYTVSHDLKAPLRNINQLTSWLFHDYQEVFNEEGKNMVRLLSTTITHMNSLIQGILDYSRVGRLEQQQEAIDLNQLVSTVIDAIAPPETIHIHIVNDLPIIISDVTRMTQIFQNLLENAVKFMDKTAGEITVGTEDHLSHWTFFIKDNGPGIEAQHREKIFQMFHSIAHRDTDKSTGIGLAIVKKILDFYHGTIWVESTVGEGSTFYFTLCKKGGAFEK